MITLPKSIKKALNEYKHNFLNLPQESSQPDHSVAIQSEAPQGVSTLQSSSSFGFSWTHSSSSNSSMVPLANLEKQITVLFLIPSPQRAEHPPQGPTWY